MLSVRTPAQELQRRLPPELGIAAVNGPQLCVAAGPQDAMASLQVRLAGEGILCRRLHTSHAFHSPMMEPAVEPFMRVVQSIRLSPPAIPIVSTVTGSRLTDPQACDPGYWATHIRRPVLFAQALETLWQDEHRVLLEVGPRTSLTTLATAQRRNLRADGRNKLTIDGSAFAQAEDVHAQGSLQEVGLHGDDLI